MMAVGKGRSLRWVETPCVGGGFASGQVPPGIDLW